jgi:hypothetical protein
VIRWTRPSMITPDSSYDWRRYGEHVSRPMGSRIRFVALAVHDGGMVRVFFHMLGIIVASDGSVYLLHKRFDPQGDDIDSRGARRCK